MSLVKFKHRTSPLRSLMASDFFNNNDDFFKDNFLNKIMDEPALNIKETDDDFQVELAAPGYSKKDFDVNIDNGYLNISAKKSNTTEEKEEDYTCKEFSYDSFERSLLLPDSIEDEKVKASYKDGILKFNLAKKEALKKHTPKVIEVS
ncbi:Hsp20/alpha crystallin family protein [Aureibaculum sp. A20]|uniref:Hsp20/alpha crystallin family protein n=1 Tax=Aureibaculum flavum TaxID=2795986 RepID=A0ABS0WSL8_9FLAO|nr:Hsp20/alpha crystallin family protein [Aureibaculum flavum]MBJ2174989.1 Hsp20/alpha crystallin family protein [Aureibaculum flavum]